MFFPTVCGGTMTMKKPSSSFSERSLRLATDIEIALEKYWVNLLLSLAIILLWSVVVTCLLVFLDPFAAFDSLADNDTALGMVVTAAGVCLLLFCRSKGDATTSRTLLLLGLGVMIIAGLYTRLRGEASVAPDSDSDHLLTMLVRFWHTHAWWLAGWYSCTAAQTLLLIFRFERAKLRPYWCFLLGGFGLLALGYGFCPPLAFLVALTVPHEFFNRYLKSPSEADVLLRGNRVLTTKQAQIAYRKKLSAREKRSADIFEVGGVTLPVRVLTTHFVAVGSAGSGKSITLKIIAQSCLPMVIPDTPVRALIFDPKHNSYSEIMGMFPISADIIILNALDRRSARYDLAADITSLAHCQAAAAILIPDPVGGEHGDRFFQMSARNLLTGILYLFVLTAPGQWRLADVLRAFDSEATVRALLNSHPETKPYLGSLGSEKTSANILSSVRAEVDVYRPVAALWEHSSMSVSLEDFLNGGKLWICGEAEEARPALNPINALILTLMGQKLLQEPDCLEPRTFLFLDELQSIHIPILEELAVKGRSKGVCLVCAFQSIQGMYRRYGKEAAESMLGQFRHKAFLKMSDVETAEWASRIMAEQEVNRLQATTVYREAAWRALHWSERTGATQTIQQVRTVLPAELLTIPAINPPSNHGMSGFYQLDRLHRHYEKWDKLQAKLQPRDADSLDFDPAPPEWQRLARWTIDDLHRLGIADALRSFTDTDSSSDTSIP